MKKLLIAVAIAFTASGAFANDLVTSSAVLAEDAKVIPANPDMTDGGRTREVRGAAALSDVKMVEPKLGTVTDNSKTLDAGYPPVLLK